MKRIAILCGFIAAFLCIAQNACAQYTTSLHRDHGNLVDARGNILTAAEVRNLVGDQIYNETYVGAKKQYKTGRKLVWGGVSGTVVGLGAAVGGSYLVGKNAHLEGSGEDQHLVYDDEQKAGLGALLFTGGTIMASLSAIALEVGIPFAIIGKKRLDWVADNYNSGVNLTYHVGATPNGIGLAVQF